MNVFVPFRGPFVKEAFVRGVVVERILRPPPQPPPSTATLGSTCPSLLLNHICAFITEAFIEGKAVGDVLVLPPPKKNRKDQDQPKVFFVIHGNNVMSAQLLEASILVV